MHGGRAPRASLARPRRATGVWVLLSCGAMALAASWAPWLRACDTPVYRYAMYRWHPAPYRVFYFHRGAPSKDDAEVNRLLDEASSRPAPTNLVFEAVDVSKADAMDRLPDEVKTACRAHRDGQLPIYAVFGSRGEALWSGRLDPAAVRGMLESPARTQIANMLHEGHAAVLVLLPGADREATKRAEQVLQESVRRIGQSQGAAPASSEPVSSKTTSPASPSDPDQDPSAPADPAPKPLRLGTLKLDRNDPNEPWLVRGLLGIEKLPPEQEKQPVLYAVFGRGRVLGPCPGDQITAESIEDLAAFLGGACSCVIKDQNPGVDLLFTWDWDATAEHLAEAEEQLNPDMPQYAEVPADAGEAPRPPDAKDATAPAVAKDPKPSGTAVEARAATPSALADGTGQGTPPPPAAPAFARPVLGGPQPESFTDRQLWKYGVGLAVAAAAVLVAGVVLLRKSRDDPA